LLDCKESDRQICSQKLIDYLCKKFKIVTIPVILGNKRPSNKNGDTHGKYVKTLSGSKIVVYNITAKTEKVVSILSFVNTLLHEFMHHYDLEYLKFSSSPHTSGFDKRINNLKLKLTKE